MTSLVCTAPLCTSSKRWKLCVLPVPICRFLPAAIELLPEQVIALTIIRDRHIEGTPLVPLFLRRHLYIKLADVRVVYHLQCALLCKGYPTHQIIHISGCFLLQARNYMRMQLSEWSDRLSLYYREAVSTSVYPLGEAIRYHTPLNAENPPSIGITTPVTKEAAGEMSHNVAPSRSSGVPKRFIGV